MPRRYWLMKCEPDAYSIDDLERDGHAPWTGVRNYQARNYMRDDMRVGDGVFFYASGDEPGITGLAEVSKAGYPDDTALKKGHEYFDAKSKKDNPTWIMVDIRFKAKLAKPIALAQLKQTPGLEKMVLTQRGSRLSVQPVTPDEWEVVLRLAK